MYCYCGVDACWVLKLQRVNRRVFSGLDIHLMFSPLVNFMLMGKKV
jgi:hypothetical protein